MLEITNLSKSYGTTLAVDHISFNVQQGEIFGFLGPNGAGKTTTINLICSLLRPDSGQIRVDGVDINQIGPKWRQKLGVVPQDIALYDDLNAEENLGFWGALYGLTGKQLNERMNLLLAKMGLQERAKEKVKNYSGGMKRRLNLAIGMIHEPKLLLLDEPTAGIDPQGRHSILDMVRQAAHSGMTILYTTHYLDEAESLCDRLAIIDHGRILASGTLETITQIVGENRLIKITGSFSADAARQLVKGLPDSNLVSAQEGEAVYSLPLTMGTGILLEKLIHANMQVENLSIKEPSLDSVFLQLTGRELRD